MSILRMIAVLGGACILFFVVVTAGTVFLPGTKIGHVYGASAEALAGQEREISAPVVPPVAAPVAAAGGAPDGGSGAGGDGGAPAAATGGQGASAPVEARPLPEQQGR